ncbi:hypothetical protein BpHYR1_054154 [Brachionus plicatilis]|uniref:Uncharacterized protein n=1 Tax=Brachionus plicatilis TaxID=10195 RepID=A0A3M7S9G5_BRAPC|nr:hypothetical protein BpHYR1_054154 [Brachionus plicatilis]
MYLNFKLNTQIYVAFFGGCFNMSKLKHKFKKNSEINLNLIQSKSRIYLISQSYFLNLLFVATCE